jgi:homoserine O-succinyltransferase
VTRSGGAPKDDAALVVGLVNNMPDPALESTERQFRELLAVAAGSRALRLRIFSIPERPRGETARAYVREHYEDIENLRSGHLDGLIVTGAEPRTDVLTDEPYWPALAKLVDWADDHTTSTVWSCLAAHAAVYHLDGVSRERIAEKLCGVFDVEKVANHSVLADVPARWRMPHSRSNTLPESALVGAGYQLLSRSPEAGTDMFLKQRRSLFLFVQGHPEYDPGALLREYQRDIGRYLSGERDTYPEVPAGYFEGETAVAVDAFRTRALQQRDRALLGSFPAAVKERLAHAWSAPAVRIYSNWLSYLLCQRRGA